MESIDGKIHHHEQATLANTHAVIYIHKILSSKVFYVGRTAMVILAVPIFTSNVAMF